MCFFFFFFQAEDGIRDGHVTGVQTCALPIYSVHVLADTIRAAAAARGLELISASEAREEATNGIQAEIEGRDVIVGKSSYVNAHTTGAELAELQPGQSAVDIGIDGAFAGTDRKPGVQGKSGE